jgi:hypothetical protein
MASVHRRLPTFINDSGGDACRETGNIVLESQNGNEWKYRVTGLSPEYPCKIAVRVSPYGFPGKDGEGEKIVVDFYRISVIVSFWLTVHDGSATSDPLLRAVPNEYRFSYTLALTDGNSLDMPTAVDEVLSILRSTPDGSTAASTPWTSFISGVGTLPV